MMRLERATTIKTTVNFELNEPKQKIMRNSHYAQQQVYEEDIRMPTQLPPEVQRQTIKERIKELQELVSQEQSVIMQTSNALNQCCMGDSRFAGSLEQVECNRLLLVACQKRQAYLTEVQRLKETGQLDPPGQEGPKGSLTINDIRLPLKKEFVTKIGTASDTTVHYFIILIRNGPHIIFTQMLSTHDKNMRGSLDFPNLIKIHGISGKFSLVLEIYSMSVSRESLGKEKKKKTPKKPVKGFALPMESPGGPTAVRTTSFTLITTLPITMKCLDKNCFSLERIPFLSPLHGMIYMRLKCMMEQNVEERGFLTMFEDVSGLGAWHRRWCVLMGNKLGFWKYPDDETRKDPMGFIDLKRCITEKVGLIPRDICARPHTFEVVAVRPPRRGEQDTLVTKTYSTMTTMRYQLSADTKEERIVWCNKINRALANIRTWHADAMRPVKPK